MFASGAFKGVKTTPYFTQPQALHALRAIAESHGYETGDRGFTSLHAYAAAGLLGAIHHSGGPYPISLGTLAANLAIGERTLKKLLPMLIQFELIVPSYSGADATVKGKMLSFALGPAAVGERWELAWQTGTRLWSYEKGIKAKASKCGRRPRSAVAAASMSRPRLPVLHPLAEEKGTVCTIPPSLREREKGTVRTIPAPGSPEKCTRCPGTDGFTHKGAAQRVAGMPTPSRAALALPCELAEPASIHPLEQEAPAPCAQVAGPKLINGARNPHNVAAGDQLLFKGQAVVVLECGYDWESDEYTVALVDTGEIVRVGANRLSPAVAVA